MHEYEKLNEHFAERSFSCVQISLYIYHHTHNVSESMFVYEFIRIKLPCIHTKAICALFFSQCLLPFAPTSKTEKKNQQHQQQRHILYFESTQFVRAYKIYGTTTMIVSITFARKLDAAFHLICGTKRKVCQLD